MAKKPKEEETPADPAAAELPDLGNPVHVFIDTSLFEGMNFAFGGQLLRALIRGAEAGDLKLLVPDITRQEVLARMKEARMGAQSALGPFAKAAKILKGLPDHPLKAVFADQDWVATDAALAKQWTDFLAACKAEILPTDGAEAARIFADYFATRPPFGSGEKKSEFPDAFVLSALRAFAKGRGCKIAVVGKDGDFEKACKEEPALVWCGGALGKVLEHGARLRPFKPEEVRALLKPHETKLHEAIVDEFRDRGFFWNDDEYDSEVVETTDEDVESLELSIIDTADDWAELAGDVRIAFKAKVQYPDPDMTYRDETRAWVSIGSISATLAATVSVPVSLSVNVVKLRLGILEMEDLEVNDNDNVWFNADEVEEVRRPRYDE